MKDGSDVEMMLKSSQIPILLACEAKYSLFGDLHMTA